MSNIYQKRLYDRRKQNGLCIDCGKPLDRDGLRCISCRSKKSENERRNKQCYKEVGICPICRKVPIGSSESSCPECRANESIQCNNRRNKSEEARKRYNQDTIIFNHYQTLFSFFWQSKFAVNPTVIFIFFHIFKQVFHVFTVLSKSLVFHRNLQAVLHFHKGNLMSLRYT